MDTASKTVMLEDGDEGGDGREGEGGSGIV
jgi:hypothetical protein